LRLWNRGQVPEYGRDAFRDGVQSLRFKLSLSRAFHDSDYGKV